MQNNNPNNYFQEDSIDLKEVFKLLINSKKLIIAITLVITTLGTIYSYQKVPLYKSTALIEIGANNTFSNEKGLIEPGKDLMQDLKINFIYKNSFGGLIFRLIENKLLQIEYISPSAKKTNHLLNEIVVYILNRHSLLLSNHTQKTKNQLTYEIKNLNDQIEYSNKTLFTQNEADKLRISNQIESLNKKIEYINNKSLVQKEDDKLRISNQIENLYYLLPSLDLKIKELNQIILKDESNLKLIKSNDELLISRAAQSPTLEQVIFEYKSSIIENENEKLILFEKIDNLESQLKYLESNDLESNEIFMLSQEKYALELKLEFLMNQNLTNTQLIGEILTNEVATKKVFTTLLSFIFGLFLSIVVVFINNSLKTSKEE